MGTQYVFGKVETDALYAFMQPLQINNRTLL
jgi:hypothetical protein